MYGGTKMQLLLRKVVRRRRYDLLFFCGVVY
jgi:hypothetical protein